MVVVVHVTTVVPVLLVMPAVGGWLNVITTSSVDAVHGLLEIVHLNVYVEPAVPLKVDVALDAVVIVPPVPLTMLHAPVPTVAALPARVTVVNPQVDVPVWSAPALAVVGAGLKVISTSSVVAVHGLLDIVQRNVYVEPAVPEKVDVRLDGVVIVPPVPLTILQAPVPTEGLLPARVTIVNPQVDAPVWSAPALAVVGFWLNVITTSSVEAVHGLLAIVHLNVYVVPAVPEKVDVLLVGVVIVPPVPLTMLHVPVPTVGALPSSVTVVNPQVAAPV
jgi:hypothetical protein